jgi:putative copper export protein
MLSTVLGALLPIVVSILLGFIAAWRHDFNENQAARPSIRRRLARPQAGSKAISGVMCYGVSEPGSSTSDWNASFTSQKTCEFVFAPSFTTSSIIQTLEVPTTC